MLNESLIDQAAQAGFDAFQAGKCSTPCLDPKVMDLITGSGNNALPILNSWTRAWHAANLAALVE